MFDFGWQEIFLVAVLTLIVVGPKDLPRVLKTTVTYIRKIKSMARDFQNGVDDLIREAELDEVKKTVTKAVDVNEIERQMKSAVDPDGSLEKGLDFSEETSTWKEHLKELDGPLKDVPPKPEPQSAPDAPDAPAVKKAPRRKQPKPAEPGEG